MFEAWFRSRRCRYVVGLVSREEGLGRWAAVFASVCRRAEALV
ncbi:MAG: hypothetical protein ACO2PM_10120 [Pyrobaculum sp.]